ncbi:hypothetical protein SAMN05216464_110209 [Mucilaginibacter pineti]|uniref:Uncharacterized protein n=1 Tax=Mucilaginibacter pineti TaxID=1391627 RepID=A0A1G7GM32_9SPHI|nr:hypothetical protein [Mucilaginibacter pineti]SDE89205.1 hypothetical protein SAMN05216464_110209 [Mucilaginibacter pineti]
MANQNNTGITDDDINKAKEYKDAMDALKTSIVGVNSKLPEFSDGLEAGLKAIGEKLPEVVEAMTKLNAQNKELAASGQKPVSVLSQLASSMFSWNSIISVGITLLTTYSGAIINWVSELIKGETRLSAFGKAMKDNAIIADAMIQTRLRGAQSAQGELTALNSLYRATQDHNVKLTDRIKIIDELKDQWPNTFKALKDETILTGKASNEYKNLKEQILAAAYAEAYKNKITSNASRALENEQKIAKERANNLKILAQQKKTNDEIDALSPKSYDSAATQFSKNFLLAHGVKEPYTNEWEKQKKLLAESDKVIYDLHSDTKLLNTENDKLADSVEKLTVKYGASVLAKGDSAKKLEQSFKQSTPEQTNSLAAAEKAYHDFQLKQIQDTANGLAKKIESQKNSYTEEQATLKRLYDNKLLSQEDYSKESQQLEEKYHIGLGEIVKRMDADELAKVQQQQKDLVDAQQQKDVIDKDQHNVDKALPWNKLEAEKQLITDKYNFEIQKAAEAGKDTAEIRLQYEQAITDATKKNEQDRKDFAVKAAQQISDKAFSIIGNNIKSSSDAKIRGLEQDKAAELSNKSLTATQRKAIEAKYQKQEAAEKVKAFKAEQKASILQAVVNGALAITKATSQAGVLAPLVIPGIIASTAIQVATIAAQKAPQYAKGGLHYQSDGRGALLPGYSRTDNTNAYLRSGEAVVVSEAMRNPWARNLVSAINVAHGGRDFSAPNTGSGYAIGGIFTDGGNANRYYNQPVNDVKDLANTLAYQLINNFPPIYVDVKDVNNQQNILAQTVNRVNL